MPCVRSDLRVEDLSVEPLTRLISTVSGNTKFNAVAINVLNRVLSCAHIPIIVNKVEVIGDCSRVDFVLSSNLTISLLPTPESLIDPVEDFISVRHNTIDHQNGDVHYTTLDSMIGTLVEDGMNSSRRVTYLDGSIDVALEIERCLIVISPNPKHYYLNRIDY